MTDDQPSRETKARATPGVRQCFIERQPDGSEKAWLHDEFGEWTRETGLEISPEKLALAAVREDERKAEKAELESLRARIEELEAKVNG